MDDGGEGGLSFDFEGGLDSGPAHPTASVPVIQSAADANAASAAAAPNSNNPTSAPVAAAQHADGMGGGGGGGGRRSFRQTVCRHWLRSLCMKGEACGFLHQYDKSRMPVCRFFRLYGECREQDCVYKHTNEDIKECHMYKLGFCPNGPDCRYRHAKLPGPPPPVEEVLQKIQQLTSNNYGNNRYFQNRNNQQTDRSQFPQGSNGMHQVGRSTESGNIHQQPQQIEQSSQQQGSQGQMQNISNGQQIQASKTATPLPQGSSRYFVVKSCNRENLELSVQQGVWATQRSNEAKLNEAFESVENVILIFSINKTRHFQGCAKMTSRIGGSVGGGNWKHAHGTAHYGRNFALKWLKLCELSFDKTRHLRNPYNENLPVKISRDCQELEPSVGEQLASLLYLEPDSDLMAVSIAAELKREEEKAKGVNLDNRPENIVPFEDNEEEEDEDEEDEDEEEEESEENGNFYGRGRGGPGGMMWAPHGPHVPFRGPRPFPAAVPGFPPMPPPDPFVMGPRGFNPYGGPRFVGDFGGPGLGPGMMFPGRPAAGFGMMGPGPVPGRAPFMRGGRPPVGMPPPFYPPPQPQLPHQNNSNRANRREQTGPYGNNERHASFEQSKGQESLDGRNQERETTGFQQEDRLYSVGKNYRNEESESEDEAPRRSRHGEGKKKKASGEIA
ncbi:30-kDa cleavage and polyadenylation specificity factor 30 [Striga hermonthica]|uniref:30-kDa cleavage and polyadenylation specificity factor 30 n=1 Tax=Striga hermonthica TaxID=68872 RepID=A0A9N7RF99_STRHE|nr:30-kDa cleavage and polyadenylation specificity factor 30 [Striga hermonthica]